MGTGEIQCPILISTDIFFGRFSDVKIFKDESILTNRDKVISLVLITGKYQCDILQK